MKNKKLNEKSHKKLYANIALLLCAFIWGTAFVAQSVGMKYVRPFTFQSVRSFLGGFVLLLLIGIMKQMKKQNNTYVKPTKQEQKHVLKGGIICGLVLCVASCFQQYGIVTTDVGKAGFITSMYMILVPVFSIVLHKKVPAKIWLCVLIAAVGMYFLSMKGGFGLAIGDSLIAICAVCFAIHIMVVDHFAPYVDVVKLSCIQFFTSGILAFVPMMVFDKPNISIILSAAVPLLYAGVMSCGVAYTLQMVGQKYAEPTTATLLMSLESVFSLLGGMILLSQIPTPREFLGCALVFAAVIWSEI